MSIPSTSTILLYDESREIAFFLSNYLSKKFKRNIDVLCSEIEIIQVLNKNQKKDFVIITNSPLSGEYQGHYDKLDCDIKFLDTNSFLTESTASLREVDKEYLLIDDIQSLKLSFAPCDIFIKLGKGHYTKIVNQNDLVTADIFEKYITKTMIFIKDRDENLYLRENLNILRSQYTKSKTTLVTTRQLQKKVFHNIQHSLEKFSLNELHCETISEVVNDVISTYIHDNNDLKSLFELNISRNSPFVERSFSLASITHIISSKFPWSSEYTSKKLIASCLLHDLSLTDEKYFFYEISDKSDDNILNDEEREKYYNHPHDSVKLLEQIDDLPAGIEEIIEKHHEHPSASGFPRKLNEKYINTLTIVLICAEHFYNLYFQESFKKESIEGVFKTLRKEYDEFKRFKEVIDIMEQTFVR